MSTPDRSAAVDSTTPRRPAARTSVVTVSADITADQWLAFAQRAAQALTDIDRLVHRWATQDAAR